jgi:uncharacterized protein YjiS (DUF1127 family)
MNIFASLIRRTTRRRTYNDLMQLDDHLLRDIGLSRSDVRSMMNGSRTAHAQGDRRNA